MQWKYFVLAIIIGAVIVGAIYLLEKIEKPSQDIEQLYSEVTIFARDPKLQKQVIVGYQIDGSYSKIGNTTAIGDVLELVPVNSTIRVYSINHEGQSYYSDVSKDVQVEEGQAYRFELRLEEASPVEVSWDGELSDDAIEVFLSSRNYRDPIICFKWGPRILKVENLDNRTQIEKPEEYSKFDKCYEWGRDLRGENSHWFSINKFGNLDSSDFLLIAVADREEFLGNKRLSIDGKDIGGPNVEREVRI